MRGEPIFRQRVAQYWTTHSGRNFVKSAAAALGVQKSVRDMLGGWGGAGKRSLHSCLEELHRSHPAAGLFNLADCSSQDPLCEEEALQDFAIFLSSPVSEGECSRCLHILGQRTFVSVLREHEHTEQGPELVQFLSEQLQQEVEDVEARAVVKAEARR